MKGRAKIPTATHNQIRDALDYNPASGLFVWKISPAKNVKAGSVAGGESDGRGYRYIRFNGEEFTDSRLAWFYMTGSWPERRVRFKDGNPNNCKFKNLTLFSGIGGGFDFKSKDGKNAYLRAYRSKLPEQQKSRALRDSFGITLEEYNSMLDAQSGVCAICNQAETHKRNGKLKALAVDHDHKTGKIRGLLCSDCNTGIGKLKDSRKILLSAAKYLKKSALRCVRNKVERDVSSRTPGNRITLTAPADAAPTT
jgi:hypothetical protein